jgi:hypothetical protein
LARTATSAPLLLEVVSTVRSARNSTTLQRVRRCGAQKFETADWIALDVVHEIRMGVTVSLRKLAIDSGINEDAAAIKGPGI